MFKLRGQVVPARDLHDLNLAILGQLNSTIRDTGPFIAGILSSDLGEEDQLLFAMRLVRLAEHIKERATSSAGMVIEGTAVDDYDLPALPRGSSDTAHHPGSANHG